MRSYITFIFAILCVLMFSGCKDSYTEYTARKDVFKILEESVKNCNNGGIEVANAFMRIYGIDIKKAGCLSSAYLDVEKI